MKIFYLLTILFTGFLFNTGPDVTTQKVLYHSNKHTEKTTGQVKMDLNRILIEGKTKLEWQDGHGAVKYAFDIKNVAGSLSLDKSGEVIYQVTSDKVNGRFVIKKANAQIIISATLVEDRKPLMLEFEISKFTLLD